MARCNLGDGKSALFWEDLWHSNLIRGNFPHLFYFVINPQASVHQIVNEVYIEDLFHFPLTTQAHEEFISMENLCLEIRQSNYFTMTDTWSYIWGNGVFSSSKAYLVLIDTNRFHNILNGSGKALFNPSIRYFLDAAS